MPRRKSVKKKAKKVSPASSRVAAGRRRRTKPLNAYVVSGRGISRFRVYGKNKTEAEKEALETLMPDECGARAKRRRALLRERGVVIKRARKKK